MRRLFWSLAAITIVTASCDKAEKSTLPPNTVISASDVSSALTGEDQELTVVNVGSGDEIVIPSKFSGEEKVVLNLSSVASGSEITFSESTSAQESNMPKDIVINIPEVEVSNLKIELPNTTVEINGANIQALTAYTAENTLVVGANTYIKELTVGKGNVKIFGVVDNVYLADGNTSSKVFRSAATEERLREVLAMDAATNHGVILTADIACTTLDVSNGAQINQDGFRIGQSRSVWDSAYEYDGYVFDGNGYTLSGAAYNNILAVYASNTTVKNLKITQTDADKARKANGGISIYRQKNVTIENVEIANTGKAGIIVNASTAKADGLSTSGNAWGGVNVAYGVSPAGGERPEFELISGTLSEDAPIYMTAAIDAVVTVPDGWTSATIPDGKGGEITVYRKQ